MSSPLFPTITDAEWRASIAAARQRRTLGAVRARVFNGPLCPLCGQPGLHRVMLGGTRIVHASGDSCWMPSAESVAAAGLAGPGTRLGAAAPQLLLEWRPAA